ncbi:hypothetical protein C1H46_024345 [Malus baccata]|uniref:Pectinesterase inhibitor domain-containing protein n=1 Tax=Malus baccata TaxID=106549 RepID=A0A540LUF9_MALBA|nr:hypothetical protein C1H46_024345 [Malus baccata]
MIMNNTKQMSTQFLLSLLFLFFFLSHPISTIGAPSNDNIQAAKDAISASLTSAKNTADYVSKIPHQPDPRTADALSSCTEVLGNAVDSFGDSLKQMKELDAPGTPSFQLQISNVLTWLSAALTDEDTCIEGFKGVAEGPVKTDVSNRAQEVEKLTHNALALVNNLKAAP